MAGCLTDEELLDYVEGRLPGETAEVVERHLDGCDECRGTVADALAAEEQFEPAPELSRHAEVGRYLVLGPIGAGSAGVVYKAFDPELERMVALKLLRPDAEARDAGDRRGRLLREAQALARLSHPHVVAIYETGTHDDAVFMALELVEGPNLRAWRDERPRHWREILDVYLQAGQGLAAAHAAGLVHGDFKPDNAVVGSDGRVRVTDFGLARQTTVPGRVSEELPQGRVTAMTRTAALGGSPAYMAPEQLGGRAGDARADVFSFCVSLHEALHGERPFAGGTIAELRDEQLARRVREPASRTQVPLRVRRALLRGLSPDPAGRFASMDELLRTLRRDPHLGQKLAAAAAVAGVVAVLAATLGARDGRPVCGDGADKLAGVWGAVPHQRLADAFAASGHPDARGQLERTAVLLDGYAARWSSMHQEACAATHVRGEQSASMLDLRMVCLDDRLQRVRSLVELLARPDPAVVAGASNAAAALEGVQGCARPASLATRVPPPSDPARQAVLAALGRRLADARALGDAGQYARAELPLRDVVAEIRTVGYAPLLAEADYAAGLVLARLGKFPEAEATLHEALTAGQRGRADEVVARALGLLAFVVGDRQGRYAEGKDWGNLALAVLERAGGDAASEGTIRANVGSILMKEGQLELAVEWHQRAIALYDPSAPNDRIRLARAREGLAYTYNRMGRLAEARELLENALELRRLASGPRHPDTAYTQMQIAQQLVGLDRAAEAVAPAEQAVAALEATPGAVHPWLGMALDVLGDALREVGRPADALERHQRARRILEDATGSWTLHVASALAGEGSDLLALGRPEEAIVPLERALELPASQPIDLANRRFLLARALRAARRDEARARELAGSARETLALIYARYPAPRNQARLSAINVWLAGR